MRNECETDRKRINITGVLIDPVDVAEAAQRIASLVRFGNSCRYDKGFSAAYVCTPNAEFMMDAQKDDQFKRILNDADLVVPDGAGVVLAARLLGYGRISRTPGYDLAQAMLSNPDAYPFSYYFLGCKPGVAEQAAENLRRLYPSVRISGVHNGYFGEEDEPKVIDEINKSGADILYVALGSPKQERWIYKNRSKLTIPVCVGVGGTLDGFAGTVRRAPEFFRRHGFEWLYRLVRDPRRAKRMIKLPQYTLLTIWRRATGRGTK